MFGEEKSKMIFFFAIFLALKASAKMSFDRMIRRKCGSILVYLTFAILALLNILRRNWTFKVKNSIFQKIFYCNKHSSQTARLYYCQTKLLDNIKRFKKNVNDNGAGTQDR